MDRALAMAELVADTHGRILEMEEGAVNRSGRLQSRERTGYDWIEARVRNVREHFFATYLAMGGGTSRGLHHERRPYALEPMEMETSSSICDNLQRSFLLAVKLATIEQSENEAQFYEALIQTDLSEQERLAWWHNREPRPIIGRNARAEENGAGATRPSDAT